LDEELAMLERRQDDHTTIATQDPQRSSTSLLSVDTELAEALDPERARRAADDLAVSLARFPTGPWSANRLDGASGHLFGLLVYRGVVAREVLLRNVVSLELLGPGDLLRPWDAAPDAVLLGHDERWNVLAETRVAVLDHRVAVRLGAYPEITEVLAQRLGQRAQRLTVTQAISQLTRVDDRLLMMLWHLVERWGRMTADGAVLPLALSHRMLAQLVGARRPSVSSALSALSRAGEVLRRPDGTWLLAGEPPSAAPSR
jgi:CRP/FNR family cyclic AMP-dependent transcriptional regulator